MGQDAPRSLSMMVAAKLKKRKKKKKERKKERKKETLNLDGPRRGP